MKSKLNRTLSSYCTVYQALKNTYIECLKIITNIPHKGLSTYFHFYRKVFPAYIQWRLVVWLQHVHILFGWYYKHKRRHCLIEALLVRFLLSCCNPLVSSSVILLLFTPDWTPSGCVSRWYLWQPQRRSGCFPCLSRRWSEGTASCPCLDFVLGTFSG